jgi:receptor protein-tyrosine kinase
VIRYAVPLPEAMVVRHPSWAGQDGRIPSRPSDPAPIVEVAARHAIAPGNLWLPVAAAEVSRRAASFRVLRHRLVERGDPRVILVSSAVDGDGKTTVAVNLAAALAESGQSQVLLMDADVRRPGLAQVLGSKPPVCLLEQLAAWRDDPLARWSVVEILPSGFHVLAIDPGPSGPRALHGPTFTRAVAAQRRLYDYIVIDAPSVLTSMEVNLVEDGVDGILFVARAHETRGRVFRRAVDQVAPGKILGVVLVDT